jgi:hypothetical protein
MKISLAMLSLSLCALASADFYSSAGVVNGALGGTNTVTDTSAVTYSGTFGAIMGDAFGQADYGSLHASASALSSGGEFGFAEGYTSFSDTITVDSGMGESYWSVDYLVDGTMSSSGDADVTANILWEGLPNGVPGGLGSGSTLVHALFPVKVFDGVPFNIRAELYASVAFRTSGAGAGSADFSHTATLVAVHITDKFGTFLPGATYSAASGHSYPTATPVPEPASSLALGLGLTRLRWRKNRA